MKGCFFLCKIKENIDTIMRRYKKSFKRYKPCPNNGVRCGNSKRCWPAGTICEGDKEKTPEKPEKAEKKLDMKAIVAGAAVVTLIGGATYYVVGRQKTLIPKAAETKRDPQSASDIPVPKYDESNVRDMRTQASVDDRMENRKEAQIWARKVLNDPDTVIIDFETTALFDNVDPADPTSWKKYRNDVPGIFQIGIVDGKMENAWDIKLNPEKDISKSAQRITGMSDSEVKEIQNKPTFKDYYPYLREKLENKRVLAFNSRFDLQVLDALCVKNDLELIPMKNRPYAKTSSKGIITNPPMGNDADVMHWSALYKGKRGRLSLKGGDYNTATSLAFTQLPTIPGGKAHDALTDVISTYDVLRLMAEGKMPRDMRPEELDTWNILEGKNVKIKKEA